MIGKQSGFARVYDQNVSRVYAFISYRVRDRHAAEDLTQRTFELALRAWSRFDPRRASETTWLLAIARNLLIDHHRRDRSAQLEPLQEDLGPSQPGPEEQAAGSPELVEALAQLSDLGREVIALRFAAEMTGPEIAAMLGLSLANVQQILSRSLRRLRVLLEDEPVPVTALEANALAKRQGCPSDHASRLSRRRYETPRPSSVPIAIRSSPPPA